MYITYFLEYFFGNNIFKNVHIFLKLIFTDKHFSTELGTIKKNLRSKLECTLNLKVKIIKLLAVCISNTWKKIVSILVLAFIVMCKEWERWMKCLSISFSFPWKDLFYTVYIYPVLLLYLIIYFMITLLFCIQIYVQGVDCYL